MPPGLKAVELRVGDTQRLLPQVASASGVRFEDADWLFWNRGAQAMLQRKPSPPVYCNEVRSLSLVEDARARGITFRGQGNGPGWLLEIGPANRVVLAGMPGGPDILQRQEWPDLAPAPGPVHGSTRRAGEAAGRSYVIVVMPDPCVDDLSGERFPATARIEVDGRRLRGCGTPIAP
ncbi:MAG: MliC family protein [Burkholderiales bacterium]|nr:MliC family protein [Burkholderiales bacterium]